MPPSFPLSAAGRGVALALVLPATLLLAACGATRSQSSVPPPPLLEMAPDAGAGDAAAPAVAQATGMQALLARSDLCVRLIDTGRSQELWAWAAPFLQATGQRDAILADIARVRAALGPIQGRSRSGAAGVQNVQLGPESQTPPPGRYANVEYTTQLVSGASALERLSFRQDRDGWRFTGYTAQLQSPAVPVPPTAPR